MAGSGVRIQRNLRGLGARATQLTARGQYAFVNQVYADANMYVPLLSGDTRNQSNVEAGYLRRETNISSDNKSITWNAPYARRQYYNQFTNYSTPGTGPKWDQKAKAIHLESWKRVVERAMR